MDRLIERVAGLDVHKASVKARARVPAERPGARHSQTRAFRTTTAGLVLGTGWPAIRSRWWGWSRPGCCWKPVDYLLEDEFQCWLLHARQLGNVPGRKTDVADAAWICRLVEHGLVRPSFEVAPPDPPAAGADPLPQGADP